MMPSSAQQFLELRDAPPGASGFSCRGIFSVTYLTKHLRDAEVDHFPLPGEALPIYEAAKARWQDHLHGLRKQKEAYTRTAFLDPLLTELGWQFIPEAELPKGTTRKRPDYCLFTTVEARQQGAAQTETVEVFRFADTALEAKKWQHPLDEVSKSETPGLFPSQQVQDYLRHAKDKTGVRFFNWAILTRQVTRWQRRFAECHRGDKFFPKPLNKATVCPG